MNVRNLTPLKTDAAVMQLNMLRGDLLRLQAGTVYHASASVPITEADATDEASTSALVLALRSAYIDSCASAVDAATGIGAHIAPDATNTLAVPVPTDEDDEILAVNEIKAKFNIHRVSLAFHASADSANAVATADATNTATLRTLANALKEKCNAHFSAALASEPIVTIPA
jgi:hypothetical protein